MTIAFDSPRPDFVKELVELASAFFPALTLVDGGANLLVTHRETTREGIRDCRVSLSGACAACSRRQEAVQAEPLVDKRLHKRQVKLALYDALKDATGTRPPWGSLTGIRPTRLAVEGMARGLTLDAALAEMGALFDVRADKLALLRQVLSSQQALPPAGEKDIDVYVGIPFCPSRCRYCSFISSEVGRGTRLRPYTEALVRELAAAEELVREAGLTVRAFYMGGGTPTALPADLLDQVLSAAAPLIAPARERTVEAGRPDSIDEAKLRAIRAHGIGRVSINPQTRHDSTLQAIGRAHSAAQVEEAFRLARRLGYDNINMDLIAGLPGEDPAMFDQTLDWVRDLAPESLTIHSLSIKRSSDTHRWQDSLPESAAVARMIDRGIAAAGAMGLEPYYLYRQKHMAGNLENIGFARPGLACLYNVDTMEDDLSVLALGAGAISKKVTPGRALVSRSPNVKQIDHYIARVDEMIARKRSLFLSGPQADILADELEPLA